MTTPQDPRSIDAIIDSLDGGPAFPQPQGKDEDGAPYSAREIPGDSGMSLRDWFAGMALQGILAAQTEEGSFEYELQCGTGNTPHDTWVPFTCYKLADAMLVARNTKQ